MRLGLWVAALLIILLPGPAPAAEPEPRNLFGDAGLIDMPSARMAADGELSAGASFFRNTQHYNLGFQVLPWLAASFHYSGLRHFDPDYPVYYDRSFSLKARLWEEGDLLPAIAVGIDDVIGTGIYSGEYVVASKRLGDVDASLGIGWGRLGSTALFRNPFTLLSDSFKTRDQSSAAGGVSNFKALFHGPSSGLFGGLVWHTPIDGLSLIGEYSSDVYSYETSQGNFKPRGQINIGATYQLSDNIALGAYWLYGESFGGSISFQLDPTTDRYPQKMGAEAPQVSVRTDEEQKLAIEALLQQRDGKPRINAPAQRAAAKNGFVDALWREGGDIDDIQVRGRTLFLAIRSSNRNCEATARLVRNYTRDIDTVAVSSRFGSSIRCALHAASRPMLQPAADVGADMPATPTPLLAGLMTIDATALSAGDAVEAIRRDAEQQRITIEALSLGESEALVYYSNNHYFAEVDAIDRLVRVLMARTPATVERFRLVAMQDGVPQQEFDILRGPQERAFNQIGDIAVLGAGTRIRPPPMDNPVLALAQDKSFPRFSWEIFPQIRHQLFDPNRPFGTQVLLAASGKFEILPGLSLNGEVETSLYDNFETGRAADSSLPHVRSDFLKYFAQGKTGIGALEADYRFRLAPDVFAVARAGYLESMFAGAGGEVLWRPEGQRWALGGDLYEVWQRDFDRLFGLQGYHVLTGHVSLYYASPWHDLNFALRAGRYLAGDDGVTLEVSRRFSTGVEIGAFATRTNVSAARFGEGSFDKGIFIRIPFGIMAPIETQGQLGFDLRPVQRDGGQRLVGDAPLYEETRRTSLGEAWLHREGFAE